MRAYNGFLPVPHALFRQCAMVPRKRYEEKAGKQRARVTRTSRRWLVLSLQIPLVPSSSNRVDRQTTYHISSTHSDWKQLALVFGTPCTPMSLPGRHSCASASVSAFSNRESRPHKGWWIWWRYRLWFRQWRWQVICSNYIRRYVWSNSLVSGGVRGWMPWFHILQTERSWVCDDVDAKFLDDEIGRESLSISCQVFGVAELEPSNGGY